MKPLFLRRGTALAVLAACLVAPAAVAAVPLMGVSLPELPRSPFATVAYSATVLEIQQGLSAAGFDAGPADGLMGNRTRQAIDAYQRANGLLATGQPSQSLLDHIRANARQAAAPAAPAALGERDIAETQQALRRLGYDLAVTGSVDARTRAAIRAYEADNKLLVTGQLSDALQAHVRQNLDGGGGGAVPAATLAEIQRGLRARGYDTGTASGSMDRKTAAAIRAYQRDSGLRETGEPSAALAAALQEGLAPAVSSPANIRQVQQALNARGYAAGPADGVMGPSTRSAIRDFRRSSGLSGDGLDQALLAALGIGAAGATAGDAAPPASGSGSEEVAFALRMGDDFNDGNLQSNPRWDVIASDFQVQDGALHSRVETGGTQNREEVGREVIRGVLGQVLGMPAGGSGSDAAAIAQDTNFGNAFRISLRVAADRAGAARMNIGAYPGREVGEGYRLVYDADAARPLSIVAVENGATRTIAATGSAPNLADGQWHRIDWLRDPDGQMLVTVDDQPYLSATDRSMTGSHEGLSFVNLGGAWRIDDVAVRSPQG